MELEDIHLAALALTALIIVYSDHRGFNYFRGIEVTLPRGFVMWSHRLVWAGLLTMILSGVFLVLPRLSRYLVDPVFMIKMGLVVVLFLNAFAIGRLSRVASERPFSALTTGERRTLMISGVLSAIGWVGAAVIGYFFL